jgi:DNA polymerase-3 subunit epsilon
LNGHFLNPFDNEPTFAAESVLFSSLWKIFWISIVLIFLSEKSIPHLINSSANKFYCHKDLENAHSAQADTEATFEILLAQINKYDELENDIDFLSEFSRRGNNNVDIAGFIRLNKNNEPVISFGKYRDKTISEIYDTNPVHFSWINNAEFPRSNTKVLKELVNTYKLKKKFEN